MKNFEESYFQDFEYGHSLDGREVQHLVRDSFRRDAFPEKTRRAKCFVAPSCEQKS